MALTRKHPRTTEGKVGACYEREQAALEKWRHLSMRCARAREQYDRARETRRRWEQRWEDEQIYDAGGQP